MNIVIIILALFQLLMYLTNDQQTFNQAEKGILNMGFMYIYFFYITNIYFS